MISDLHHVAVHLSASNRHDPRATTRAAATGGCITKPHAKCTYWPSRAPAPTVCHAGPTQAQVTWRPHLLAEAPPPHRAQGPSRAPGARFRSRASPSVHFECRWLSLGPSCLPRWGWLLQTLASRRARLLQSPRVSRAASARVLLRRLLAPLPRVEDPQSSRQARQKRDDSELKSSSDGKGEGSLSGKSSGRSSFAFANLW